MSIETSLDNRQENLGSEAGEINDEQARGVVFNVDFDEETTPETETNDHDPIDWSDPTSSEKEKWANWCTAEKTMKENVVASINAPDWLSYLGMDFGKLSLSAFDDIIKVADDKKFKIQLTNWGVAKLIKHFREDCGNRAVSYALKTHGEWMYDDPNYNAIASDIKNWKWLKLDIPVYGTEKISSSDIKYYMKDVVRKTVSNLKSQEFKEYWDSENVVDEFFS